MWRLFVLCIAAAFASMIQLGDKDFDDEDKQLKLLLTQKMQRRSGSSLPDTPDEEMTKHFEDGIRYTMNMFDTVGLNEEDEEGDFGRNGTRRQADKPKMNQQQQQAKIPGPAVPKNKPALRQTSYYFPNVPETKDVKERIVDMLQQQIYLTQYRMRDLQGVIDKYSADINYRIAFIYCRLETILFEMKVGHTYMNNTVKDNTAHTHFIYYTYFMKKNIDVTYIVEHLIQLHTDHMNSKNKIVSSVTDSSERKGNRTKKQLDEDDEEQNVTPPGNAPNKPQQNDAPEAPKDAPSGPSKSDPPKPGPKK